MENVSISGDNRKQWWAPVWTGLVMDGQAKHYRKMKNAIWLFLYLVLNANRRTGFLMRKAKTVAFDMGISRDAVLRWLNLLRKEGYITTKSTGRCLLIQICKWKGICGVEKVSPQKWQMNNICSLINPTSHKLVWSQNHLNFSGKPPPSEGSNDITIKKNILKNDTDKDNLSNPSSHNPERPISVDNKELSAMDIATILDDRHNLALYVSYSKRYPSFLLKKVLDEVRKTPIGKIKKSRGALFNYLVQKYAKETL